MVWSVYTDGSASPNPGPGGAGSVILKDNIIVSEIIYNGGYTTNNRMELYALIMTYPLLPDDENIILYTDSQYVKKGSCEWVHKWIRNNWITAGGKPVKNTDLWKQLVQLQKDKPNVVVQWIKAHNGHIYNERADELANNGRIYKF